jgi:hypothetical protein
VNAGFINKKYQFKIPIKLPRLLKDKTAQLLTPDNNVSLEGDYFSITGFTGKFDLKLITFNDEDVLFFKEVDAKKEKK